MNTVEIGKFIKEQLRLKGHTQENLADYLGISKQAVSQNLSGKSSFEISNLMMIAEFLDVKVDDILYAGSERETMLSKFYNQDIDKINPDLAPEQPDSNGKTLLDYCIESNDLEKFKFLFSKQLIIESLNNNPRFVAFLIKNNDLKLLQSSFRTPIKDEEGNVVSYHHGKLEIPRLSERSGSLRIGKKILPMYANLSENMKEYVSAVLACTNDETLKLIPELRLVRMGDRGVPKLVQVAIEKDVVHILKYFLDRSKYNVNKDMFDFAINYEATECAKFLYDNYDLKTVENLLKINDRAYVQDRVSNMNLNKHQMSNGIIDAVKANDLMAVKALINIVDKKSLDLALEEVNFEDGLAIAKVLLDAGAVFSIPNAYDSNHRFNLNSVTSAVKFLMDKVDESED
ncbi:helix-turn-helix domain-containing protein [Candidatus Xianfuyuplasma coldseepsis]|uniref:Helix-turn-helix transcriptional regulator n=1 Tax=Candidatus Xianfuyuplasma coldseepsis TaxID=2782163 RepID=A0A7L7KQ36_9MOLU|nr:helix-turn-helix transcriptional regulator [Xianfuyuplasma coldseepsis]QMS84833.1 helix-turn-helix transcriptional regulator [Xianfuyuplasma coldseepsis]